MIRTLSGKITIEGTDFKKNTITCVKHMTCKNEEHCNDCEWLNKKQLKRSSYDAFKKYEKFVFD